MAEKKPPVPVKIEGCEDCWGKLHQFLRPGCQQYQEKTVGPSDIPWKKKIEYLHASQGVPNDKWAFFCATLKEAKAEADYRHRWAPDSPGVILRATTTYEYVKYKPKEE